MINRFLLPDTLGHKLLRIIVLYPAPLALVLYACERLGV